MELDKEEVVLRMNSVMLIWLACLSLRGLMLQHVSLFRLKLGFVKVTMNVLMITFVGRVLWLMW